MRWLLLLLVACGDASEPRVLVYSRTLGYRHDDAIVAGVAALPAQLAKHEIGANFTEDPSAFTSENLARYRAVIFLYTTGNDILDADGKTAFEAFIRDGGGWLGIHSTADTEYDWPFFQELMVTHFRQHPAVQPAALNVEATAHPAMAGVPAVWEATDEWYDFLASPRVPDVTILATIDEATYTGGDTGADHPMIWAHERLGGRAVYSEPGHVATRWQEPAFLTLIDNSIDWVIRKN